MAKLSSQVKGIVHFAVHQSKGAPAMDRFGAKKGKQLRRQLRSPGVSKKERRLVNKLVYADSIIVNATEGSGQPGAGELSGVRKAIAQQQKASRMGGGRHPNQGGGAPSSHTSTSNHKKRTAY